MAVEVEWSVAACGRGVGRLGYVGGAVMREKTGRGKREGKICRTSFWQACDVCVGSKPQGHVVDPVTNSSHLPQYEYVCIREGRVWFINECHYYLRVPEQ